MSGDDANRLREAEERGDAQALYDLAADLEEKGQDDLAERACLAAAKLGHPGAADSYAHYLYERDDRDEAVQWWQRAAEAGDAESAFNAGVALEELDRTDEALESYAAPRRAATRAPTRTSARCSRPPATASAPRTPTAPGRRRTSRPRPSISACCCS